MSSRETILTAIRRNLGETSTTDNYQAISREYNVAGKLTPEDRLNLFEERLRDYGAGVHRCSSQQIPETILQVLAERKIASILLPPEFPEVFLPQQSIEPIRDHNLSYEQIDRIGAVLTTCTAAIALTGTIILRHSSSKGRRALTLIPDYHLCVVFENQVVETVPEGIRLIAPFSTSPLTTISGPSATSDIEMTRIQGVHGPRTLDVILVSVAK